MNEVFKFTNEQKIELLKRSYMAVDGLWFMMVEKEFDFETALKIDVAVWEVLPKIQVRKILELTGYSGSSASEFLPVLNIKFGLEEYDYKIIESSADRLEVKIKKCPWVELLRKSDRLKLAERIGREICTLDLNGWANAFHKDLQLEWISRECISSGCSFAFNIKK